MSELASTAATLDLLRRLRDVVAEFAGREEQLQRELQTQEVRLRHQCESHARHRSEHCQAALATLEASLEQSRRQLGKRWDDRLAAIQRAQKNALRQRLVRIEERENQRKFELQRDLLDRARDREARLKDASAAQAEFTARLKVNQERLGPLESSARVALRGYAGWRRMLESPGPQASASPGRDPEDLLTALHGHLATATADCARVRSLVAPLLFSHLAVWIWFLAVPFLTGALAFADLSSLGWPRLSIPAAAIGSAVGMGTVGLLYLGGWLAGRKSAPSLALAIKEARQLSGECARAAKSRREQEEARIAAEEVRTAEQHEAEWNRALATTNSLKAQCKIDLEARLVRATKRYERRRPVAEASFAQFRAAQMDQGRALVDAEIQRQSAENEAALRNYESSRGATWAELATHWRAAIEPVSAALAAAQSAGEAWFPPWSPELVAQWEPPAVFSGGAQFGRLDIEVPGLAGKVPQSSHLASPCPERFTVPALLALPQLGSLIIETRGDGREPAIATLNNTVLRLLASAPPGRLSFTLIDPVELGRSFSGLMHLADYDERLINSRIWTQPAQIEQQLANLNEHIEKVSQMYLRNEFATIADYNRQAGRIAERYHFLVVADFPASFSETAVRRLMSIAASGARCGVHLLLHWDLRKPAPADFVADDLRAGCICVRRVGGTFIVGKDALPGVSLALEPPPNAEIATELLHKAGRASVDSNRVQVPFTDVAPGPEEVWSVDTAEELRVPVGRTGATKLQYLSLGKGTRQHALVAGKTGSGKSTLFHVIITDLALWCSPEQVEFYLVDFKKGVEFRCYAAHRLPHARVVAIESDREFGLSVLERLDEELKRRGELFRNLGVQDLPGFRRAGGGTLPRTLLLIDEFQEFFVADDRVAQGAALLLDRIVRQGRAFGIHVILGSQTLGGAYSLARATLGQMVVRIALQCNEADAYLIMDDSNPAPRLLSRPGEAIYNDSAGSLEGNSPFQTVWLGDQERDHWLRRVNELALAKAIRSRGTVVFEGNAPADLRENELLRELLDAPGAPAVAVPRVWLGAPNSIKGPTEAAFHRQSGNNLLIIGQREEAALAMLGTALIALAAQGSGRLWLIEAAAPDSSQKKFFERVAHALPAGFIPARAGDLDAVMAELAAELTRRTADETAPGAPCFVVVHELQKFKKLRHEEDFSFSSDASKPPSPGAVFDRLITEGPGVGLHVICTCDSYNSLTRALSRKAMSEFELRVLFQMSTNDSASLCDSPKASDLGLHRALLHNGQMGFLETFRPYALPEAAWLAAAGENLARIRAGDGMSTEPVG